MSEVPPSQTLIAGKYQLVRMIGRGGMGSVWEARHITLGTPSAVKFIESDYADSHEARSRFDKEAKAAATIQSKHAIQIYDHGVTDDGKPYIVMELLQGEPLDKRIDRMGRLSLQETARIIQQVCRGLARAHERGIIHRDLKPENIFLVRTPDDDEEVAKVLDFGIAKMSNSPGSPGVTSSTKTGAVLGTPFYMSPEQARGLRNVDHRTDIWSLGVIAYKCILGKLPFDGESVGDLLVKICTSPVPVPSQQLPGVPPNFDAWFMRALEREPDRRFSTATELSDALAFAAGIATRGAAAPYSQLPSGTAAMPSGPAGQPGLQTPHSYPQQANAGMGMAMTPQPQNQTPPPGAMTNAPFTSERIPGVPSSSGKLIGLVAAVVVLGAAGTGVFLFKDKLIKPAGGITAAAVSQPTTSAPAPAAPPTGSAPAPATSTPPVAANDADAGATATATPTTAKTTSKPGSGKPPTAPTTTPPTPPTQKTATPSPPAPAPAPAPTQSAKKPNKNDPGY